ncbi:MAG: tetratricopeptide repeat protein [Calditrichaeota bacterium]|nr:tetratricopeptide repeat protein [Calditrichota bacterium]
MKKLVLFIIPILVLSFLTSCRPPELEGAFVDYNAGRFDNALKLAQEATQKYPDNAEAWFLLGEIYGKKERYLEMKRAFDKSLKLSNVFADKIKAAKIYYYQNLFNRGVNNYNTFTKMEDRTTDEAKKQLKKAIEYFKLANIVQTDYKSIDLVALSYTLIGEKDSALVYYTKLTEMAPDSADGYIKLGRYELINSDYDKAIKALEKALSIDPSNPEAIQIIAEAYDRAGMADKAIKSYQKAMEVNKEEKAFPFNLGLLYFKLSSKEGIDENLKNEYLQKCIEAFSRVIELDPSMKEPYDFKSNCEILLKKYDEALVTLKQAVERFPDNGPFWYNLGVVYSHLNNVKEATNAFKKAEELGVK